MRESLKATTRGLDGVIAAPLDRRLTANLFTAVRDGRLDVANPAKKDWRVAAVAGP